MATALVGELELIMFVVTVLFCIKPSHVDEFMAAMLANASTSLQDEPGCRQFDVCQCGSDATEIFLYEVYDSEADFGRHLAAPHFLAFNEMTAPWVQAKTVRTYRRLSLAHGAALSHGAPHVPT